MSAFFSSRISVETTQLAWRGISPPPAPPSAYQRSLAARPTRRKARSARASKSLHVRPSAACNIGRQRQRLAPMAPACGCGPVQPARCDDRRRRLRAATGGRTAARGAQPGATTPQQRLRRPLAGCRHCWQRQVGEPRHTRARHLRGRATRTTTARRRSSRLTSGEHALLPASSCCQPARI